MEPKTFQYGETISYLKLNGNLNDQVEVNKIISSTTGYSFVADSTLGQEGSSVLQLTTNKNIIIKNELNAGSPAVLTTNDEYTLKAFTTSFWIKQLSTSSTVEGYHPLKITINAQTSENKNYYFTYTNKTTKSFDLEIRDENFNIIAEQNLDTGVDLVDKWMHVSFVVYKGQLALGDGTLYDGYFMDLFVDGDHKSFAIYEGDNLPIIDKVVSASISAYDQEKYLVNADISDFKIVNKLEYYPSDKSNFEPEEVDNGPAQFIFFGEISTNITRDVQRDLYHGSDYANIISKVTARGTVFDWIPGNDWVNENNLVTPSVNNGKVYQNAVYFSGNANQGFVLKRNILWGLSEFTIASWVKNLDITVPSTLLEIVPSVLVDLTENDLRFMKDDELALINDYKTKFRDSVNSLNASIYDPHAVPHGISLKTEEVEEYIADDWNYVATTFKNGILKMFVNGKLIRSHEVNLELSLFNKLTKDMYSIIGASFVDDLPASGNKSSNMYMDDFIIYDQAIFPDEFDVPTSPMQPWHFYKGMPYAVVRFIANPAELDINTIRTVVLSQELNTYSRRIVLNPDGYYVFRFSI